MLLHPPSSPMHMFHNTHCGKRNAKFRLKRNGQIMAVIRSTSMGQAPTFERNECLVRSSFELPRPEYCQCRGWVEWPIADSFWFWRMDRPSSTVTIQLSIQWESSNEVAVYFLLIQCKAFRRHNYYGSRTSNLKLLSDSNFCPTFAQGDWRRTFAIGAGAWC